ncbi:sigma factor-like helix-turn-helix DNA-binding protein [Streptomyces fructofermentans]|uniref:sigma factor-like helix-turn-helix DNA-binding protein n=1 Tax=Streptomyces fructofermentans TaxID=152141 RepID=UPI0037ADCB76
MDEDEFTALAAEFWPRAVRTARLLTGDRGEGRGDAAERLARAALARVYARRRRIPADDAEFYVRRALVRGHLRRARRRRLPVGRPGRAPVPYTPDPLDPLTEVLAGLPPRRRAVAVLHHWDGLSLRETAALLVCSPGAVRAHARRAVKALRAHPAYTGTALPGSPPVSRPLPVPFLRTADRVHRRLRRRASALLVTAGALLLTPPVLGAVRGGADGAGREAVPVARTTVRVVTPGEHVGAAPGVELWLTREGTHWSAPRRPDRFQPAGGRRAEATLTLRSGPAAGRHRFLTGVLRSPREPSRVELATREGTFTARVVTLAGSPGWSAWYVDAPVRQSEGPSGGATVTAYGVSGEILARTGGSP